MRSSEGDAAQLYRYGADTGAVERCVFQRARHTRRGNQERRQGGRRCWRRRPQGLVPLWVRLVECTMNYMGDAIIL